MPQIIKTQTKRDRQTVVSSLGDISEYFVLSMFDASPDCVMIVELDGAVAFMNDNGQSVMEIDDFGLIAGELWLDLWPDEHHDELEEALELAKDGFASRVEAFSPTKKGTPRWWDVTLSPVHDKSGEVVRILSVARDITTQVEREDRIRRYDLQLKDLNDEQARTIQSKEDLLARQGVLLREIDHRVKNSLAMITSMIRMQAKRETDEDVILTLQAAANRVMSIGRVHERLYKGDDVTQVGLAEYLRPICRDMVKAMGLPKVYCRTDIADMDISSDKAIAIGLVTTELVGNALRHAFPGGAGNVHVTAFALNDVLELVIEDDGVGLTCPFEPAESEGLGMKVITLYLKSLNGTMRCENKPDGGAIFTITLPDMA